MQQRERRRCTRRRRNEFIGNDGVAVARGGEEIPGWREGHRGWMGR